MAWEGISDITSTEGNLKNFTRICHLLGEKTVERKLLVVQIRETTEIRRKNEKVIERHLSILEKIQLIESEGEFCRLSPFGKMLYQHSKELDLSKSGLSEPEKLLYFKILSTGKTLPQLALLLYTMDNNKDVTKEELIYRYNKNYLKTHLLIWNRSTLERRLHEYETAQKLRRPEQNRFDCMIQWLKDIGMISGNRLNQSGINFLKFQPISDIQSMDWSEYRERIFEQIFYLGTFVLKNSHFEKFNINSEKHTKSFLKYVGDAFILFGNKSAKTLSSIYFTNWVPDGLLLHESLYCSKEIIDALIDCLCHKKIIVSVMAGDYQKEKLFKIAGDSF